MTAEQQGVSPASAGGAAFPDEVRRRIWVAAEDLANTIGCTVVNAPTPLPPFKRRPVLGDPSPNMTGDEDGNTWAEGVDWALSWGCQLTFGRDEKTAVPYVQVSLSDEDLRRGITQRKATRAQVAEFARLLVEQFGEPAVPDPRDAEVTRLRRELDARPDASALRGMADQLHAIEDGDECAAPEVTIDHVRTLINCVASTSAEYRAECVRLGAENATVKAERDRLRTELDGQRADKEQAEAAHDRLRAKLDQHLADENSAQAANDRLRAENERLHAAVATIDQAVRAVDLDGA
jgi:hypothetical protein